MIRLAILLAAAALTACSGPDPDWSRTKVTTTKEEAQPVDKGPAPLLELIQTVNLDGYAHRIFRDRENGCEYISLSQGGIIERKDANHQQICRGVPK